MFICGFLLVLQTSICSCVLYSVVFYVVLFIIFTQGRLPEGVFLPTLFALIVSLIVGAVIASRDSKQKYQEIQFVNIVNMLILFSTIFQYVKIRNNEISEVQWWTVAEENKILGFDQLLAFKSDKPIIVMPNFYPYLSQTVSPLDTASDFGQIWEKSLPLGWANSSPEYQKKVKKLKLSEDLFSSLAAGDAYLATTESSDFEKIEKYLARHKGIEIAWDQTLVFLVESGLAIWRAYSTEENS